MNDIEQNKNTEIRKRRIPHRASRPVKEPKPVLTVNESVVFEVPSDDVPLNPANDNPVISYDNNAEKPDYGWKSTSNNTSEKQGKISHSYSEKNLYSNAVKKKELPAQVPGLTGKVARSAGLNKSFVDFLAVVIMIILCPLVAGAFALLSMFFIIPCFFVIAVWAFFMIFTLAVFTIGIIGLIYGISNFFVSSFASGLMSVGVSTCIFGIGLALLTLTTAFLKSFLPIVFKKTFGFFKNIVSSAFVFVFGKKAEK